MFLDSIEEGKILNKKETIEMIFEIIPHIKKFHSKYSKLYIIFDSFIKSYFQNYKGNILDIFPIDGIIWPHIKLGNTTNSYSFFNMVEFMIYNFYWINRDKYKIIFDIGANLGPDSIILDKFGYQIHSFEPDPWNFDKFINNIKNNNCNNIKANKKAVSNQTGTSEFIRVHGNVTANHLSGVRDFYGEYDRIIVETININEYEVSPDLIKINVEGHENEVIQSIDHKKWQNMDAIVEVHNEDNRRLIFNYFKNSNINIFSQTLGWEKVKEAEEISIRKEYIFISSKDKMPWNS